MPESPVSASASATLRDICRGCGGHHLRRVGRNGFLQVKLFPLFGYYPWECSACRRTQLLRQRGTRVKKQD